MITSQVRIAIILTMVAIVSACDHDTEPDHETIESNFQKPEDGKLTEKQVADYILIRQQIIREVNKQKVSENKTLAKTAEKLTGRSKVRYFDEIEKQVAQLHNMSYDEFLWIKDVVISTQTALLLLEYYDLNNRIMTLLDKTLSRYKEINADINNPREQLVMNDYVEEMKEEMINLREKIPGESDRSEALQYNIMIISKFKAQLASLEQHTLHSLAPQE